MRTDCIYRVVESPTSAYYATVHQDGDAILTHYSQKRARLHCPDGDIVSVTAADFAALKATQDLPGHDANWSESGEPRWI